MHSRIHHWRTNMKNLITGIALALGLSAGVALAHASAGETQAPGPQRIDECDAEGQACTKTCSPGFHGEVVCFLPGYPRCVCVPD
jgi:hypothetical protein